MNQLTEQEVLAAFQLLGLSTEKDRAKFAAFAPVVVTETTHEYVRLDNTTHVVEGRNAKLA